MTLDADAVVERRRLKRRITFWRIIAVVAIAVVAAVLFARERGGAVGEMFGLGGHIARVNVSGFISDDRKQQELLRKIAESSTAKAVIVRINSPGGSTAGGEALYTELRALSEKKPVVAVFATTATSAAYMAAIAADHIIARANSITGSVGVIVQWAEVSELLKSFGVDVNQIKSGDLKAVPNPFEPTTEEQREATRTVMEDSFQWFVNKVDERRDLSGSALADIRTGRIYTGAQARALGLVDQLGGEREARKWLSEEHDIPENTKIIDWKPEGTDRFSWVDVALAGLSRLVGMDLATSFEDGRTPGLKSIRLDGLVSVWQPEN
ncbi:signal peptide peptidase SppA [Dichotomicrobium thermohalophilum]|uniref:Protease-4 n=1 Tax=Dichotomicrobium thermohalophilum TaxID=933063 RepID=A0A397PHI2_9HYPH|nr:signal peptide peptidase SppA [Dichotomicrobium thermohalophilum]RIA47339.1 protease-4 [Dichotomicrobium thermohalophilum]